MAAPVILVCAVVTALLTLSSLPGTVLGEDKDDFDFDDLPGTTHEFKVEVAAGETECFYQRVKNGSQIYISFEVLRGADRNVDVIFKDPKGSTIASELWNKEGNIEHTDIEEEGDYEVCVDNSFSRFASKLVYMYFLVYKPEDWEKYSEDLKDFDVGLETFTKTLQHVDKSIQEMEKFQAMGRRTIALDYYLITSNNEYVQNLSIALIAVVLITGAVQLYFVKNLFNTKSVTPTAKPRA